MFESDQYQLLDFGAGRKLERFGMKVLDRPSRAAVGVDIADPGPWANATARFDSTKGGRGEWDNRSVGGSPDDDVPWLVRHKGTRLALHLGGSGNVGLFPEQAGNWDWIADQVDQCRRRLTTRPPHVLNLFAYTGGASLAAASAGAEVTHVDSSAPTVALAKKNADLSGLAELPIRWVVEDAIKFAAREGRRGNGYDGIILDPPTYGHGPNGRPFKFREHLGELMALCAQLLSTDRPSNRFLLFSCHTPGFGPDDAASTVASVFAESPASRMTSRPLAIEACDGRKLAAGVSTRWQVF